MVQSIAKEVTWTLAQVRTGKDEMKLKKQQQKNSYLCKCFKGFIQTLEMKSSENPTSSEGPDGSHSKSIQSITSVLMTIGCGINAYK